MDCKKCKHYGFYQMIKQGSLVILVEIPCLSCKWFTTTTDNFEPINSLKVTSGLSANPQYLACIK